MHMKKSRMDGNGKYMEIHKFSLKTDKEKKRNKKITNIKRER